MALTEESNTHIDFPTEMPKAKSLLVLKSTIFAETPRVLGQPTLRLSHTEKMFLVEKVRARSMVVGHTVVGDTYLVVIILCRLVTCVVFAIARLVWPSDPVITARNILKGCASVTVAGEAVNGLQGAMNEKSLES